MAVDHILTHLIIAVTMRVDRGHHHHMIAAHTLVEERGNTEEERSTTEGTTNAEALEMSIVPPTHHLIIVLMSQSLNLQEVENISMPETGGNIEDIEVVETAKEDCEDQSTKEH